MIAATGAACAALAVLVLVPGGRGPTRSVPSPGAVPLLAHRIRVTHGVAHLVEAIGRTTRAGLGRRPEPAADRRAGAAVALVVLAGVVGVVPTAVVAAAAALAGRWRTLRRPTAAPSPRVVIAELPELIDLVTLTVGAGLTVPASLGVLARWGPVPLRPDLERAAAAIAGGARLESSVSGLGTAWGAPARPLVHALVDHLRYGTPLGPGLDRVALEARAARRRSAETRARRLPVLLLFPLVFCTLPAFGLLTVAPLVAGTLGSLDGSHLEVPASSDP